MGMFSIFKFFKDHDNYDHQTSSRIRRAEEQIQSLADQLDSLTHLVAQQKGNLAKDTAALERINTKFMQIIEGFGVVRKISEDVIPGMNAQSEVLEEVVAQQNASSMLYVALVEALVEAGVVTLDDLKPKMLN